MKRKRKAGKIRRPREVALSPVVIGAELAECQCCGRRTSKKNGGGDEECGSEKAVQGRQPTKGGSSQKERVELK